MKFTTLSLIVIAMLALSGCATPKPMKAIFTPHGIGDQHNLTQRDKA